MSIHFELDELTHTNSHLDNRPTKFVHVYNLETMACMLESIRASYGHPIYVSSGYRSKDVNRFVGGAENSAHRKGLAVDIYITKQDDYDKIINIIKQKINFDQLIVYRDKDENVKWLHIGMSDTLGQRNQVLTKKV